MQSCLSKGWWNGERHCGGKREGGEPGWTWVESGIGGALFPHQTGFQFSREQTTTTGWDGGKAWNEERENGKRLITMGEGKMKSWSRGYE